MEIMEEKIFGYLLLSTSLLVSSLYGKWTVYCNFYSSINNHLASPSSSAFLSAWTCYSC